ncbi:hypothetical protein ESZ53_05155 [Salinibacterium sp. UTAS2018]|uniref:hypothetical protein n=1 Tax=Salinibacterium sp. UTAS2018 TaxID=2508880 RepID=UPI0010097E84|nr:hypothetical protein [Salinibacterium sp. UTAS2018]QAV69875.1 hypothetical protein ESZ53_05155 [Salinibacterium sp. UTAS2018]
MRLSAAALVTILTVVLLTACGLIYTGPSDEEQDDDVRTALMEAVPTITGVHGGAYYDGPRQAYSVKIYVSELPEDELPLVVDEALKAVWQSLSFSPAHISLSVVEGPMPPDASTLTEDGFDLGPAIDELGLLGAKDTFRSLIAPASTLEARYGEWTGPNDG